MPIVVFQHAASEPLGRLASVLRDHAFKVDVRRLDLPANQGGKAVPADYDNIDGVISLGGPQNVADAARLPWLAEEIQFLKGAHARQLPVLGICLGHQLIAHALGGEVAPAAKPEWGVSSVSITVPGQTDTILAGVPWTAACFQAHNQEVTKLPADSTLLASSPACRNQVFRTGLRTYGFQFHFEWTAGHIDAFAKDAANAAELTKHSLSASILAQQAADRCDELERVGLRLCNNLANCMFPMLKKLRA